MRSPGCCGRAAATSRSRSDPRRCRSWSSTSSDRSPRNGPSCHPDTQSAQAQAAGLQIVDMRMERLRAEFFDIGAVIYFLRKVIWTVPDFTVRALSRTAARTARAHRGRRALRRPLHAASSSRPASRGDQPLVAQHVQRVLQIGRVGADDLDPPAVGRMGERQRTRMQPLAFQPKLFRQLRVGAVGRGRRSTGDAARRNAPGSGGCGRFPGARRAGWRRRRLRGCRSG